MQPRNHIHKCQYQACHMLNEQQEKHTLYREENSASQNHQTRLSASVINFKYNFGYNRAFEKRFLSFLKCTYTVHILALQHKIHSLLWTLPRKFTNTVLKDEYDLECHRERENKPRKKSHHILDQ